MKSKLKTLAFEDSDSNEIDFFVETILTKKQMERIISDDSMDEDGATQEAIEELILIKDKKAKIRYFDDILDY